MRRPGNGVRKRTIYGGRGGEWMVQSSSWWPVRPRCSLPLALQRLIKPSIYERAIPTENRRYARHPTVSPSSRSRPRCVPDKASFPVRYSPRTTDEPEPRVTPALLYWSTVVNSARIKSRRLGSSIKFRTGRASGCRIECSLPVHAHADGTHDQRCVIGIPNCVRTSERFRIRIRRENRNNHRNLYSDRTITLSVESVIIPSTSLSYDEYPK